MNTEEVRNAYCLPDNVKCGNTLMKATKVSWAGHVIWQNLVGKHQRKT